MAKFSKGKTGMILKTAKKGKKTVISRAKSSDIKGMSTKNKIKFGSAIKAGGVLGKLAKKVKNKKK